MKTSNYTHYIYYFFVSIFIANVLSISIGNTKSNAQPFVTNGQLPQIEENTPRFFNIGGDSEDNIIFRESFENVASIDSNGGAYNAVTLVPGKEGNGVLIDVGDSLSFPTQNNLLGVRGTITFWIKPNWSGKDPKSHYFLHWMNGHTNFRILNYYSESSNNNYFVFRYDDQQDNQREVSTSAYEPDFFMQWQADEWHHVQVFWDLTANAEGDAFIGCILDGDLDRSMFNIFKWEGVDPPPPVFHIGSTHDGRQRANAVIDELTIYSKSYPDISNVVDGYISLTHNDGVWQNHETIHNSPQDAPVLADTVFPGQDVLFYQNTPFEPTYEGTVPEVTSVKTNFHYQIAQDEYETLFLNVYSRIALNDIKIDISNLVHSNGKSIIPKDDIDIRVVKNWFQAGRGPTKTLLPHFVPELLLKDDTVPLDGKQWDYQNLPSQPLHAYARTTMPEMTSKQITIVVHASKNMTPGTYSGEIIIETGTSPSRSAHIHLQVLPFSLKKTGKDFMLYHRGRINKNNLDHVGIERYSRQISDIARHGFNGLTIYPEALDIQDEKLRIISDVGFSGNVITLDVRENLKSLLERYDYTPWFYGVDEPNILEKMNNHINLSIKVHQWGGMITTAISRKWADKLKDPADTIYDPFPTNTHEPLDLANISVYSSTGPDYFNALCDGTVTKTDYETYYWQMMDEDPRVNRFLTGYFLWNTGADGIFPYVYQHVKYNPYDDFDIWSDASHGYRDHLVTYPSQEGPIPTIQWEALREGIDDVRYLETWQYYKNIVMEKDEALAKKSEAVINTLLDGYKDYYQMRKIPIAKFNHDRMTIINEILTLMQLEMPHPVNNLRVKNQ